MSDILKRVLVAAALIVLLATVLIFGGWYQCAVLSLAALLSVYELRHALSGNGRSIFSAPAYAFAAFGYALYKLSGAGAAFTAWMACVMCVCAERVLNKNRATPDTLLSIALMVYPTAFYAMLMLLAEGGGFDRSRVAFLATFAMPLMGDTCAYFAGRLFGKRKLSPDISPKKTVAGAYGGVAGGALGGLITYFFSLLYPDCGSIQIYELIALGLLCGIVGQFGDLFASCIKRYAGVKDYGRIFPGHGGMTDRLDSVLFCAPLVYAAFTLWPQ